MPVVFAFELACFLLSLVLPAVARVVVLSFFFPRLRSVTLSRTQPCSLKMSVTLNASATKLLVLTSASGVFYVYYRLQDARQQFKIRLIGGTALGMFLAYEIGVFGPLVPACLTASPAVTEVIVEKIVVEKPSRTETAIGKISWFVYGFAAGALAVLSAPKNKQ